ncbi:MAG: hypothetical protein O7D91_09435 [Planctomycetota bacterium]|nr:hypothetical protein [Planctomycetota bacterium]
MHDTNEVRCCVLRLFNLDVFARRRVQIVACARCERDCECFVRAFYRARVAVTALCFDRATPVRPYAAASSYITLYVYGKQKMTVVSVTVERRER